MPLALADVYSLLARTADIPRRTRAFAETLTPNFLSLQQAVSDLLDGSGISYAAQIAAGVDSLRSNLSGMISPAAIRRVIDPVLIQWAESAGIAQRDPLSILQELYIQHAETSPTPITVQRRAISYGSPTWASPTGNGALYRLTVDMFAYAMEAVPLQVSTYRCTADQTTGASKHRELFRIAGQPQPKDWLGYEGSGYGDGNITSDIQAKASIDSFLANASFDLEFTGAAGDTDKIQGWTAVSPTAITHVTGANPTTYRGSGAPGVTDGALSFDADATIAQVIQLSDRSPNVPIMVRLAVYRAASADGNIIVSMGQTTRTVDLTTLADDAWNIVTLLLNEGLYPFNFAEDDAVFSVEISGNTTGTVRLDDVVATQMQFTGGAWLIFIGGNTPWRIGDTGTFTDVLAGADAVIQAMITRGYGTYLPHKATTPTIAEPT